MNHWYRVTFEGALTVHEAKYRTWSGAVMTVIHERFPDCEMDTWNRELQPDGNKFEAVLLSGTGKRFFLSGVCVQMTAQQVREMFAAQEIARAAA